MARLCKTAESSKLGKKELPLPATPPLWGVLRCHLDCSLAFCLVCSRSGSSTARLCLYFLQLSAFVKGFFMVMILLLGPGDTPMKWWIWKRNEKHSPYPTDHVISVQTCHCQTHSPWPLTHNYEALSSQSFTKLWRESQQQQLTAANMTSDRDFQELCTIVSSHQLTKYSRDHR